MSDRVAYTPVQMTRVFDKLRCLTQLVRNVNNFNTGMQMSIAVNYFCKRASSWMFYINL